MSEQHGGKRIADLLTLRRAEASEPGPHPITGGVALAEAPPKVRHHDSLAPAALTHRKTLTIRHATGHRIVALVEIASRANKDRKKNVDALLNKLEDALVQGIHVLLVDLFPPGKYDPLGLHGEFWDRLGGESAAPPTDEPITLASYVADAPMDSYWEHLAVGAVLPDMPLFLDPEVYIKTPLESTYQTAWQSTPQVWREALERPNGKARRKRWR